MKPTDAGYEAWIESKAGACPPEEAKTMPDQPRCVWLTREQRDCIDADGAHDEVVAAWDAAPADAIEAVAASIAGFAPRTEVVRRHIASAVLRALGMPEEEK